MSDYVSMQLFNAMNPAVESPKKPKKGESIPALEKVLQAFDPNEVLVSDARKYQQRMEKVEERKTGYESIAIRKRFVPDYCTNGYHAANSAKALRARFEGEVQLSTKVHDQILEYTVLFAYWFLTL